MTSVYSAARGRDTVGQDRLEDLSPAEVPGGAAGAVRGAVEHGAAVADPEIRGAVVRGQQVGAGKRAGVGQEGGAGVGIRTAGARRQCALDALPLGGAHPAALEVDDQFGARPRSRVLVVSMDAVGMAVRVAVGGQWGG